MFNSNNEEEEEIEVVEEKKTTKEVKKQVVNSAIKSAISLQIKMFLLSILSFLMPLFAFLAVFLLIGFLLIYIFYFSSIQSNLQNEVYNSENKPNSSSTRLFSALYGGNNIDFTNIDAKSFVVNSTIPHGFPMSGTISQLHCSNFYNKSLGGIVYKASSGYLYAEEYCVEQMKKDDNFSDFAQKYAGGNWNLVGNHGGLDIAGPVGTKVFSTTYGKVVRLKSNDGWGKSIDISSTDGNGTIYTLRYAHLSSMSVKVGDEVFAGSVIGLSGNTGNSSGPHLHYGICEGSSNFQSCYTSRKDTNYKSRLLDPFPFSYNMIINGSNSKNLENNNKELQDLEYKYLRTKVKSGVGTPGLDIQSQNITGNLKDVNFNSEDLMSKDMIDYVYIKVGLEQQVAPIILKTFHFRERGNKLTNPEPVNKPGWSGKNEGVYGFYSDFSSLGPVCQRTVENFGPFGTTVTYKQFENQTTCAALALKSKSKTVENGLNFIKPENFSIEKPFWNQVCKVMSRWNAGEFYCYNKLYPSYSDNSRYSNMPVYTGGRFLNYNKQDGFLKYALDNFSAFQVILNKYTENK